MKLQYSVLIVFMMAVVDVKGSQSAVSINFTNYGYDNPSCQGMIGSGRIIDQQYNSKCFTRQVECDGNRVDGTYECPHGYTFIGNDTNCYAYDSSDALNGCGVTVNCGLSGIEVLVDYDAVFNQTDAPLQFGENSGGTPACVFNERQNSNRYRGYFDFDGTMTSCIDSANVVMRNDSGDGYYIEYKLKVKRWDRRQSLVFNSSGDGNPRVEDRDDSTNVVITREKCFMADIQCNYNPDGTVTASYQPSSPNALDEHDESTLTFAMERINCNTGSAGETATVYVSDEVCFRTRITSIWHQNIRLSTTHCWATSNSNPGSNVYNLFNMNNRLDDTLQELCDDKYDQTADLKVDAFKFLAFRYQNTTQYDDMNDEISYGQTMYVHCEVNACEIGDTTSPECSTTYIDCGNSKRRARREVSNNGALLSKLSKSRVVSKAIVLPPRDQMNFVKEEPRASYNLLSDTLSIGLFAVGCVFGLVAIGLFIVTKRQVNQLKYSTLISE